MTSNYQTTTAETKECYACGTEKPLSSFHRATENPDGRRNICKQCRKDHKLKPRDPNPAEKTCSTCRVVYPNTPEFFWQYHSKTGTRRTRSQCKKCHYKVTVAAKFKARYGLDGATIEQALEAQDHRCAICREPVKLYVDHNDATHEFRGMLCDLCNRGLGFFHEDVKRLAAAITYLTERGSRHGGPDAGSEM